jgi:hypothetical protein
MLTLCTLFAPVTLTIEHTLLLKPLKQGPLKQGPPIVMRATLHHWGSLPSRRSNLHLVRVARAWPISAHHFSLTIYDHRTKSSDKQNVLNRYTAPGVLFELSMSLVRLGPPRSISQPPVNCIINLLTLLFQFRTLSEMADNGHGLVGLLEILDLLFRKFDIDCICARCCQILWAFGKVIIAYR